MTSRLVRLLTTALLTLLLTIVFVVPAAASVPASASAETAVAGRHSVVGRWLGEVTRQDGTVETGVTYRFSNNRTVVSTGDGGTATGTWSAAGPRRVNFSLRTETDFGYVIIVAQIDVRGNRFTGTGQGTAYDSAGNPLGSSVSTIVARRT